MNEKTKLYNKIIKYPYGFLLIILGCNASHFDLAIKGDIVNLEKQLLKKPTIINSKDNLGKTMLHYAVCSGNRDILDLLYIYGAKLDEQDITGMTALHVCAMWDLRGPARWLISRGADINVKDKFGDNLLHTSAIFNTVHVGKYLKTLGISMTEKNNEGLSPVELAKKHRNHDWIREIEGKECE